MADKAWKKFERDAALLFGGARFWANSGERADFEGEVPRPFWVGWQTGVTFWTRVKGQCKLVKTLSLEALTKLAEEPGVDVVCVKVRRGTGKPSSGLVVMTFENYERFFLDATQEGKDAREKTAAALREQRPKVPFMRRQLLPDQDTKRQSN